MSKRKNELQAIPSKIAWTDEELAGAGINKGDLMDLIRLLTKASKKMCQMGMFVYGNDGKGHLMHGGLGASVTHKPIGDGFTGGHFSP